MIRMTLFSLLKDCCVSIPSLQRNYVHGRDDTHAKEVREHFVKSLDGCINGSEINLDVIYGVCDDTRNVLIPIDGQQRLTTLWLSAVYAATKSKDNALRLDLLSKLSRFSYESRPLAATFCRWLTSGADVNYDTALLQAEDCWGEDPTVHSMLTTLRLIHEKFRRKAGDLLKVLCGDKIHFEFSEVHGKDSDLYVKINARGKQLTQWENFKGRFSECLKDENKNCFDKYIETLSDKFYSVFKKLPDDAFFALFARLTDYALRTSGTTFREDKHKNLFALANSKVDANLSYVPIDEFCLVDIVKELVCPFLRMVQWALDNNEAKLWYWKDGEKNVADALFFPNNADERDFSFFLYEYFRKYYTGDGLKANDHRALRLVANILENVTRDNFNRIDYMKQFIEDNPSLYCLQECCSTEKPMQIKEEFVKGKIYKTCNETEIKLMQKCEELMHGRIRIAIFDAIDREWKIGSDCWHPILEQKIKNRLEWIKVKLETWNNKDKRRGLLIELIQHMPWDVSVHSVVPVNLDDSTYRIIISNDEFAPWLQRSLVDESVVDLNAWFDPNNEYGKGNYAVDWRKSLCEFISRNKGFEGEKIDVKNDCRRVRWHGESYYLYTKTNNPQSFPIGDWRIGYYLGDTDLQNALKKWCPSFTMQMNYSGELVFEMNECEGVWIHLWTRGIAVEFVYNGKRSGIQLVEITEIEKLGHDKFFRKVSEMFKNNREDLFQKLVKGTFKNFLQ